MGALSSLAFAGDIYLSDTYTNYNPGANGGQLTVTLDGNTNNYGVVEFNATRTAPGGSTNLLPGVGYNFNMYCVDFGDTIAQGGNYYPSVTDLLGSTTISNGPTVFFDATRTDRMDRLWGSYYSSVVDGYTSTAFQVAQWEIAFDNDMNLGTGTFSVQGYPGDPVDAGELALAQSWLNNISSGGANQSASLVLLSGANIQDQITLKPVPEPSSFLALGVGAVSLMSLRRRKRA